MVHSLSKVLSLVGSQDSSLAKDFLSQPTPAFQEQVSHFIPLLEDILQNGDDIERAFSLRMLVRIGLTYPELRTPALRRPS